MSVMILIYKIPLIICILNYLSWHVWFIADLNGPNIRVVTVGIRALVPENLSLWDLNSIEIG